MQDVSTSLFLDDEQATDRFGADLALALAPGDVVLLSGDLGAGKSALARAAIRSLAGDPGLEVPSPTFTLVQPYEGRIPSRHFDLYRIAGASELEELGFEEARASGVVFVEWPEHAAAAMPADAIRIALSHDGDGRRADIACHGPAAARLARSLQIREFLARAGHARADRAFLLGDASARTYETVTPAGPALVLMNAPRRPDGPAIRDGLPYSRIAHLAESVTPFVAIDRLLRAHGFAAPEILSADLDAGLLLIEHLGSAGFLDDDGAPVPERYSAAARLLARLHLIDWPHQGEAAPGIVHAIPAYDARALGIEVELPLDWTFPRINGRAATSAERQDYLAAWAAPIAEALAGEQSLVLRDYHSPNLIWRAGRHDLDRIGLIDFQDAVIGPSAYDVASLAQDARVTISPELEAAIVEAYAGERAAHGPFDRAGFARAFAIMAAQRNAKILGIFVRLDARDGKPHYLRHLPRIRAYLERSLRNEALSPVAAVFRRHRLLEPF